MPIMNVWLNDIRCIATKSLPHVQMHAAPANIKSTRSAEPRALPYMCLAAKVWIELMLLKNSFLLAA